MGTALKRASLAYEKAVDWANRKFAYACKTDGEEVAQQARLAELETAAIAYEKTWVAITLPTMDVRLIPRCIR